MFCDKISLVQPAKQNEKLLTKVLYLNKSAGIPVNPVQSCRQFEKLVAKVLYLNKSAGIPVNPVQFRRQPEKLVSPGIKGNADIYFSLLLLIALLPNRRLPELAKLPNNLAL